MKRQIFDCLGIVAVFTVMIVVLMMDGKLQHLRQRLTAANDATAQGQQALKTSMEERMQLTVALSQTDAALQQTRDQAAECRATADELASRLRDVERLAGLLECEVDRLKPLRTVRAIIVHHSESIFGDVPTIDAWHRERGFDCIGYHYVICNGDGDGTDGEIQFARHEDIQGAHAKANHRNEGTIGICLIGTTSFTSAQRRSLHLLLDRLCRRHGLKPGPDTIQIHHERCPGDTLDLPAIVATISS